MYRLLLVTDQENLLGLFESFGDWQALGFAPPLLLRDPGEAKRHIEAGEVDAVSYALPKEEGQAFYAFLAQYPQVRGLEAASDLTRLRRALNSLRRQLRESEQDEISADVRALLQYEWFHTLLGGAQMGEKELRARLAALQLPLSLHSPVVVAQLSLPHGQLYIEQVWRYGSDRLKVALHNFFDRDLPGALFVLDVMSLGEIKLMLAPKEDIGEKELLELFYEHLTRVREEVKGYLDLGIGVRTVGVYQSLAAMTAGDDPRILYQAEEA